MPKDKPRPAEPLAAEPEPRPAEPAPRPAEPRPRLATVGEAAAAHSQLEAALFEIKRVIVGQEGMLERVFIALLSNGHLLLEGVPGLAKTLTISTVAKVLAGTFHRVQFTPDLVPSDLVGTRIYRPDSGSFDTELGPVFCNFLLADEINRAPAKVQSALLEVMQERQVTIGKSTYPVGDPFLVLATQNPIESEGTYPLPEAQVDRFMMKVLVDYPNFSEEMMAEYSVALCMATRHPQQYGVDGIAPYIAYGASPRGSINLVHAARAMALLRGRAYALPQDVQEVAKDVLRHRLVLTYQALAEEVSADALLTAVLTSIPAPRIDLAGQSTA